MGEWFHGVEHMTRTADGYVRWKGQIVEHYSGPYAFEESTRPAVEELARRCLRLEEIKKPIDMTTVIFGWPQTSFEHEPEHHSDLWYECVFSKSEGLSAEAIRAATEICRTYNIDGICDPAYVADLIDTGFRRGRHADSPIDPFSREPVGTAYVVGRLLSSYAGSIAASGADPDLLPAIIDKQIKGLEG